VTGTEIREGMAVFDPTGRRMGRVETLRNGHFFLTHETLIPLVQERIVVDADRSVVSVDVDGVHLRHDRRDLVALHARPRDAQSSRQVAPGEDISSVHRGDEDRRPLDHDDLLDREGRGGMSPLSS